MNSLFENYFKDIFGERWAELRSALLKKELQCARWNRHLGLVPSNLFSSSSINSIESTAVTPLEILDRCFTNFSRPPVPNDEGLLDFYSMDPASVIVARALDVQVGDRVLDMCAAPGGKTLILIEALFEDAAASNLEARGEIIANEISEARRERLKKVIQLYVPRAKRDGVWIKGLDGAQFGLREPEMFDRVLLDAPCSGERHLLENPKEYQHWTLKRTKGLAQRQYSLICGALLALKAGGTLVYSTCSISPIENDDVIKKLLQKKSDRIRVKKASDVFAKTALAKTKINYEETTYGLSFLPDRCGFGPMYFCVLEKV